MSESNLVNQLKSSPQKMLTKFFNENTKHPAIDSDLSELIFYKKDIGARVKNELGITTIREFISYLMEDVSPHNEPKENFLLFWHRLAPLIVNDRAGLMVTYSNKNPNLDYEIRELNQGALTSIIFYIGCDLDNVDNFSKKFSVSSTRELHELLAHAIVFYSDEKNRNKYKPF